MKFILRWLVCAIAIACALWLIPGITVVGTTDTWVPVIATAVFLALLDLGVKPILQFLSLPVTILTLGIFYIVVNTFLLYCASWIASGLFGAGITIASFGSAFLASIVISIVSSVLNSIVG